MHPEDEQLVSAYIERGDQRAFTELVERHQERIFGYLVGMVRDREAANDLFQETFIRAIGAMQARRGSYEVQGRWLSWVMRIARNAALDYFRSRRRWSDMRGDNEDGDSFWETLPDDSSDVSRELINRENGALLEICIQRLPPEQREVLLLRHEAGLTFKEIADLTECSINTALGRMRYALLNLRRMLEAHETIDSTSTTAISDKP